jgi:hypothetical protein
MRRVDGPRPPGTESELRRRGSRPLRATARPQPRQPLTTCGDRSGSCSWNSTSAATHPASAAGPAASFRSPQPLLVARRARRVARCHRGGAGLEVVGRVVPAGCRQPRQARSAAARDCRRARPRATRELGAAAAPATTRQRSHTASRRCPRRRPPLGRGRAAHAHARRGATWRAPRPWPAPPTELLGLARVPARERVRAESDQGEGDVVGKADSPRRGMPRAPRQATASQQSARRTSRHRSSAPAHDGRRVLA